MKGQIVVEPYFRTAIVALFSFSESKRAQMGISATCQLVKSDVRHWVIAKKNRRTPGERSRRAKLRIDVGRNIEGTSSMNIKRERLKSRRKETS